LKDRALFHRIASLALSVPRRIAATALLLFVALAAFGAPVMNELSAGGFQDPASESAQATRLLAEKFGESDQQLLITVAAPGGPGSKEATEVGTDIVKGLRSSPAVHNVSSPWTLPPESAKWLVSRDGHTGLIVASLDGGEDTAQKHAETLCAELVHDRDGVTVRAGGMSMMYSQVNVQSQRDLLVTESLAVPLTFLALVWVFGGLLAAALPVAVGLTAIAGSLAILRAIAAVTSVSVYALNLTTALGFALAIDYTLLITSRYRDERCEGSPPGEALARTVATAGRTVLYSAGTVALSLSVLAIFPLYFLRSFAYAGVATVVFAAAAAVVVTPAMIAWLGLRLDSLDVRRAMRKTLGRPEPVNKPVQQWFWYRSTKFFMRHAVPVGLAVIAALVAIGIPFLHVKWGYTDERVLPESSSARQVGDQLRDGFAHNPSTTIYVVIPDAEGLHPNEFEGYAKRLSTLADVSAVSAPTGIYESGTPVGPPSALAGAADGSAFLTLTTKAQPYSRAAEAQLDQIHATPVPDGRRVLVTGLSQINRDNVTATTSRLPLVLGLIAAITAVLLFLVTGSVVLPVKALALNVLSLSASFGAMVWIFQDGHLDGLGTATTGVLIMNMAVLLFCLAFGLSMDYEMFLISRIREYWEASMKTRDDNDESVALGIAHTGRVITAAALVMSIVFAALIASQVSFMRMFGFGLTLAILADATLIRMILVPAFMRVLGRANWWAPGPLARVGSIT